VQFMLSHGNGKHASIVVLEACAASPMFLAALARSALPSAARHAFRHRQLETFAAAGRNTAHSDLCRQNADGKSHVNSLCEPQHLSCRCHSIARANENYASLNSHAEAAANVTNHPNSVRVNGAAHDEAKSCDDRKHKPQC
jgi:hypothetical protein